MITYQLWRKKRQRDDKKVIRLVHRAAFLALWSLAFGLSPVSAASFEVLHQFAGPEGETPHEAPVLDGSGALYGTATGGGNGGRGALYRYQSGAFTVLHHFMGGAGDGSIPQGALLADSLGNLYGTTEVGGTNNLGVVYRWDTEQGIQMLKEFTGPDGVHPRGGVIRDAAGNLYGTTFFGGEAFNPASSSLGYGTVFKIDFEGHFSLLHSFAGNDGYGPWHRLVRNGDFLYGGTAYGPPAAGTIFKVKTDGGAFSVISPGYSGNGYNFVGGLVRDPAGNLYGAAMRGGATGIGGIYQIDPAGNYQLIHAFSGPDGAYPTASLVLDATRNKLYGTTQGHDTVLGPGPGGYGTVFEFDLTTHVVTRLHAFSGSDGDSPVAGLARDAAGNLYGVTAYGGASGKGVLFKVTP